MGIPLGGKEDPYDAEFTRLRDRIRRLDRDSFTKGLREAARQFKESEEVRAAHPTPEPKEPAKEGQ